MINLSFASPGLYSSILETEEMLQPWGQKSLVTQKNVKQGVDEGSGQRFEIGLQRISGERGTTEGG